MRAFALQPPDHGCPTDTRVMRRTLFCLIVALAARYPDMAGRLAFSGWLEEAITSPRGLQQPDSACRPLAGSAVRHRFDLPASVTGRTCRQALYTARDVSARLNRARLLSPPRSKDVVQATGYHTHFVLEGWSPDHGGIVSRHVRGFASRVRVGSRQGRPRAARADGPP